ncbi:MAG: hypothetical protein GC200_05005 [Tepidisphaera sp.]|nr:hypothetical protein [Tepidisphaera sp.]
MKVLSIRFWAGFAAVALAAAIAAAHPKPGAHADVRISIEDDRVQFDCLMNILFADQLVNSPRAKRDDVLPDEEDALRTAMIEYFGGGKSGAVSEVVDRPNRVTIDGVEVTPVIRELAIIRPPKETRPGFVPNPALMIPRIHVIAEYPCKGLPKAVSMVWGTYPRDFLAQDRDIAPSSDIEAALTSAGDLSLITFKKSEPEVVWHAPSVGRDARFAAVPPMVQGRTTRVSLLSLAAGTAGAALFIGGVSRLIRGRRAPAALASAAVLAVAAWAGTGVTLVALPWGSAKAAAMTPEAALAAFQPLHANIYRAFDYTREGDIYDALKRSVDGPMLDDIYNEVYRSLVMQEEGGALSRVKKVTNLSDELVSSGLDPATGQAMFKVKSRWRVEGVVYHWGHSHTRENEYLAQYTVAARPDGWRIVAAVPLEQKRIQSPEQAASQASATAAPPQADAPAVSTTPWRPNR